MLTFARSRHPAMRPSCCANVATQSCHAIGQGLITESERRGSSRSRRARQCRATNVVGASCPGLIFARASHRRRCKSGQKSLELPPFFGGGSSETKATQYCRQGHSRLCHFAERVVRVGTMCRTSVCARLTNLLTAQSTTHPPVVSCWQLVEVTNSASRRYENTLNIAVLRAISTLWRRWYKRRPGSLVVSTAKASER